ncbi:MAG: activator of Hsp90 ATPase 1 family protein [Bacilli bacterium]|nr:activator of Hsp90 ATPase 1 family protein [Bacilli bacterium]
MVGDNPSNGITTKVGENELVTTRIFDAPRELVFEVWTKPEHLAQWWGPKGFTNTFQEFDFRPGGTWQFIMHGPDGVDYDNKSIFVEIVQPERIVFQNLSGPKFQVTATFEDFNGKTRLNFHMLFDTAAEFDNVKTYAVEGNQQTFERLEAYVTKMSAARE